MSHATHGLYPKLGFIYGGNALTAISRKDVLFPVLVPAISVVLCWSF